jgi:hypothetical protein
MESTLPRQRAPAQKQDFMAVASAKRETKQAKSAADVQRNRDWLLEQLRDLKERPTPKDLAEYDREYGAGTAQWLSEQLAQVHYETEDEKKRRWHTPDAAQAKLVDKKQEHARGSTVQQKREGESHTVAQKGLNIQVDKAQREAHVEQMSRETDAEIVEEKRKKAGDGKRSVHKQTTTTTRGDAREIQMVEEAEEKAEKAEKAKKAANGLAGKASKKAADHDFRVAATEKEVSTYGPRDEEKVVLAEGAAGKLEGSLQGPGASAKVGGAATVGLAHGVAVSGNVELKAVAFAGGIKYSTPELEFALLGEQLRAVVDVAFKAEELAEVKGDVKLNIKARPDGLDLDIGRRGTGVAASAEAFAGLRAGVDAAVKLDWKKKPDYFAEMKEKLVAFFQDTVGLRSAHLPDWVFAKAGHLLFGEAGWVNLLKASAGVEGSAGIGGSAAFTAAFGGGRIKFSSKLKGTIGLGFGGKAAIDASILEGLRFLAVLTAKGGAQLAESLGLNADRLIGPAKKMLLDLLP